MIRKQFTLYLENRPGRLARLIKLLAEAKVNIEGISVAETTDVGLVQLVTSSAAKTRKILVSKGVPFTVQDVIRVSLRNEPGALSKLVSKVAEAGLNINYVYATGCDCAEGCDCYAIVSAPDLKGVEKAWRSLS